MYYARKLIAGALLIGAALGLGGCFHHAQAVTAQPLPPPVSKPLKEANGLGLGINEGSMGNLSGDIPVSGTFRCTVYPKSKCRGASGVVPGLPPCTGAASETSLAEINGEGANIVTPKKGRPLNLGLIGRQKRFYSARAGRENRHVSGHIFG